MQSTMQIRSAPKLPSLTKHHSKSTPKLPPIGGYQTSSSIMAKKYKLFHDGSKPFIETSTLLEPANRVVAWAEGDEKREIAGVLSTLRKKHDDLKKVMIKREMQLRELKVRAARQSQKQLETLQDLDMNSDNLLGRQQEKIEFLEIQLELSRQQHQEELLMTDSYRFMKTRIKQDLIKMKIKSNGQEESLKSKEQLFTHELQRYRKTNAGKIKSKNVLNGLMKNIGLELKNQKKKMQDLHKSIKNKEDAVQRRLERIKRQHEIAEAAANQNKDSSEIQMRGALLVNKLWDGFLKRKMERQMRKAVDIEDAFQRIKAATGLIDVQDIVHKFLTRQQTYSQLLVAIGEAETRIDQAKSRNQELSKELHSVRINREGDKNVRQTFSDVDALRREKDGVQRQYNQVKERAQKAEIIYDQVTNWAYKILHKLQSTIIGGDELDQSASVPQVFKGIATIVEDEMRNILEERHIDADFLPNQIPQDLMFDEFTHKNIRVKPITGKEDDFKEINQSRGPGVLSGDFSDDQGENFNKIADLEMEEQRYQIKQRMQDIRDENMRKKKGDKNGARPTLNEDLGSPLRGPDFRSKSKPSLHSSPYRM